MPVANKVSRNAIRCLAQVEDVRTIGLFLELLGNVQATRSNSTPYNVIVSILTCLLSQLQVTEANLLNEPHRKMLCDALDSGRSEFAQVILRCFERMGSPRGLPLWRV